ncbi:hypothetical protein, partial [Streptomyces sp. NPDC047968]|uniref:hypothetical protein n=1 Tax=Streptomyces sp. NPDC047968 TaxID=3155382 RepID=UPI0034476200
MQLADRVHALAWPRIAGGRPGPRRPPGGRSRNEECVHRAGQRPGPGTGHESHDADEVLLAALGAAR